MDIKPDFDQQTHPELREGERWLGNSHEKEGYKIAINYRIKRLGYTAFSTRSEIIKDYRPIFVMKSEYEEVCNRYKYPRKITIRSLLASLVSMFN